MVGLALDGCPSLFERILRLHAHNLGLQFPHMIGSDKTTFGCLIHCDKFSASKYPGVQGLHFVL